jgi:hypothetical protein
LTFGIGWVKQGTVRWRGGTRLGYAGRVANGGAAICANPVSIFP